jgi:FKBP-type peptidyl-prolyl cis-trans isomerase SlyD
MSFKGYMGAHNSGILKLEPAEYGMRTMQIQQNSAVLIHFHLTSAKGEVLDSSRGRDPLAYLHGHRNLVPGVERALAGQEVGAKLEVEVAPVDGYGERNPALDIVVPMAAFPEESHSALRPGAMFQGPHPIQQGQAAMFTVQHVAGDQVACTANHPLAGMTLHFQLEVVDVREATAAEVSMGRVDQGHDEGCCHDPNCGN